MNGLTYIKLFKDILPTLEEMSFDQVGRLICGLLQYSVRGASDIEMKEERFVYSMLKRQIDRDAESYEAYIEKQHANGRKGGRPRKDALCISNGADENPENPTVFIETQPNPEKPNKDKDKEKEYIIPNKKTNKSKKFIPPTLEEVSAYCAERKNGIDAEKFIDHYASVGWKVGGKADMKDWKAAVRTWERNNYSHTVQPLPVTPQTTYSNRDVGDLADLYRD